MFKEVVGFAHDIEHGENEFVGFILLLTIATHGCNAGFKLFDFCIFIIGKTCDITLIYKHRAFASHEPVAVYLRKMLAERFEDICCDCICFGVP